MKVTDSVIRNVTGNLLKIGVYLSMAIVVIGGLVYLSQHSTEAVDYAVFDRDKVNFKTIAAVFSNLYTLKASVIIQFGLIMLIFTPIARIIFATVGFAFERDWLYVIIGLCILFIIILSFSGGFAH